MRNRIGIAGADIHADRLASRACGIEVPDIDVSTDRLGKVDVAVGRRDAVEDVRVRAAAGAGREDHVAGGSGRSRGHSMPHVATVLNIDVDPAGCGLHIGKRAGVHFERVARCRDSGAGNDGDRGHSNVRTRKGVAINDVRPGG